MLIHCFWFFFHLKETLFIEQCVILVHRTPEIIFTPKRKRSGKHRVLQRAWRHIQLDKCVGSLIRTEQCKHHLSDFNMINTSTPVWDRACLSAEGSAARWRRCLCYNRSLLLVLKTKKLKWKRVFLKTMKSVHWSYCLCFFARSRWTSVALRPILDYVLTNQHSADAYIICF